MIRDSKYTSAEHLPSSIDKEPIKAIAKTWDDMLAEFMNTNTLLLWSSIDTEPESVMIFTAIRARRMLLKRPYRLYILIQKSKNGSNMAENRTILRLR